MTKMASACNPVIVVHGGAGVHASIVHDQVSRNTIEDGVKGAARAGYRILQENGQALDAAIAAVAFMEDRPNFNAGTGSKLTKTGDVEMDASVMDGASLRAGGVACIQNVANPVHVARLVMDKTDHVLLVGEAARDFAQSQGVPLVPKEELLTEKTIKHLKKFTKFTPSVKVEFNEGDMGGIGGCAFDKSDHDTVGAVSLDCHGNVAYATSTGGINAKMPGRCGDSPIPGCGGYADNDVGASSTTGHGEAFLRTCLSYRINMLMQQGHSPQTALEESLAYMANRIKGYGGAIAVNTKGDIGMSFTTEGMSWASIKDGKVKCGIYKGECTVEDV